MSDRSVRRPSWLRKNYSDKKIDGKLVLIGKKLDMVWLKEQLRNL